MKSLTSITAIIVFACGGGNTKESATSGAPPDVPGSGGVGGAAGSAPVPPQDGGAGGASPEVALDPCLEEPDTSNAYFVAQSGDDKNDGSAERPFATLTHAVRTVPDGATVIVRPGRYEQRVRLDRRFEQGIVVRAAVPYQARLRYAGPVVQAYYGANITLEGFDIAHTGLEVAPPLVHIQRVDEEGGMVEGITLRNNVIHDSRNGELVKINNGVSRILLSRNMLYNQSGPSEQVAIDSATEVTLEDNILFNDFAGSSRYNDNDTGSFIGIKGQGAFGVEGSLAIVVRRNVLLNWEGSASYPFIRLGGWGSSFYEADNVLIENNLLLGNSKNRIRAALGISGGHNVTFRHNTVSGDLPGAAYALRLAREGENPRNDAIRLLNNIFSDATRTMVDFSDSDPADTLAFMLRNNVYYNGGRWMPADEADHVNIWDEPQRIVGDPGLPLLDGLVLPRWDPEAKRFADGSASICEAFVRLAETYCRPSPEGVAVAAAWDDARSTEDLFGAARPTDGASDVGACQSR